MIKLLKKLALFSLPFLVWVGLVVLVDPYNYFDLTSFVPLEIKKKTSFLLNERLWRCVEFKKTPSGNILLGDSRIAKIDTNFIKSKTGDNYFNFAYGGASLAEIVDTFEYAKKITKLSNVYIGVSFNHYNSHNARNMFSGAELLSRDYKYYLSDRGVAEALFYNLASLLANKDFHIGTPSTDKDTFWKFKLTEGVSYFYQYYEYPTSYYQALKGIADYCKKNNINLVFIIPPTHVELQHRVTDYNLTEAENRFKKDLASLGKVYDFDYVNEITKNRDNFTDPFHFDDYVMELVVNDVWGKSNVFALVHTDQTTAKQVAQQTVNRKIYQ